MMKPFRYFLTSRVWRNNVGWNSATMFCRAMRVVYRSRYTWAYKPLSPVLLSEWSWQGPNCWVAFVREACRLCPWRPCSRSNGSYPITLGLPQTCYGLSYLNPSSSVTTWMSQTLIGCDFAKFDVPNCSGFVDVSFSLG